uniref:BPI2 domain-containing protein n=1 Tax=Meloidogyne hapla TaxID=6305 RepID=A0A1I8BLV4_MELHA
MVHILFDTSAVGYDDFIQTPLIIQEGSGLEGSSNTYNYFKGASPFQRGYGLQGGAGIGDVLRGLWRFFLPLVRRVGTTVSAEALNTGQRVLERVNQGENIKEALTSEGKKGIDTLLEKGGLPKQFGSGGPRKNSINSITNALDFFQIPPTNVSISSSKVFEILPSNPLTDTPYHFKIHSSQNYIDLSKCYLFTEFRIRKEDANGLLVNLVATDNVAPIQLIGHTFINNMRISINGREVFNSNSLMAYKSYLSHELSFSTGAKSSHLSVAGHYGDKGLSLESGDGYTARKARFASSTTAQFMAKIDADLFNQPLYLINHCEIDIEILPNESKFVLIAPANAGIAQTTRYHFEVVSCKLYVKKVDIMDGLALDIAKKLDIRPARYAIRKTMMKPLFISQGRYEFNADLHMNHFSRTRGPKEIAKYEATHSTVKASLAERAIRNLKQRLYRYFSQNHKLNWTDILPKIIEGINKSFCRVHGMRPIDVNFKNAQKVWKKIYGNIFSNKKRKGNRNSKKLIM